MRTNEVSECVRIFTSELPWCRYTTECSGTGEIFNKRHIHCVFCGKVIQQEIRNVHNHLQTKHLEQLSNIINLSSLLEAECSNMSIFKSDQNALSVKVITPLVHTTFNKGELIMKEGEYNSKRVKELISKNDSIQNSLQEYKKLAPVRTTTDKKSFSPEFLKKVCYFQ
ncbi:hypothetical protein AKO1_015405, partial [Acrasis kona]